jgi:hypothetical protein
LSATCSPATSSSNLSKRRSHEHLIDPGLSGAIAYIGKDGITVYDMPTTTHTMGNGAVRRRIDFHTLATIFEIHEGDVSLTVIEEVGAMPHDGPIQAFSFGKSAGAIEMGATFAGGRRVLVRPGVWKTTLGLAGEDKNASRALASKLFPAYAHLWPLKKHDGRAEAVLLAFYGSKLQ